MEPPERTSFRDCRLGWRTYAESHIGRERQKGNDIERAKQACVEKVTPEVLNSGSRRGHRSGTQR